ncbi:MAG: transglycosylase SLT domain-containing protein [Muribaculaceae bacterium]|nr:transglycosylase SLT domain-containing protein [Muribaculaceae bacterium]
MTGKYIITLSMAALALLAPAKKQEKANVLDIKHSITDNAIVYPESFETDTQKILEGWYMRNYTATDTDYAEKDNPNVSDAEIERRLKAIPTVIEMPFNSVVRSYIDRYMGKSRAQVAATLGLSLYYMPIFEQALEARGLPLELKYLPVIESGLDPNAVSSQGAAGLWQFMIATAKGMGLEVNSLIDERRDPYASSAAAADYLKDLFATYGDWSLAIAAYNCGPGTVNKAIRRAGGETSKQDFWSIYSFLPAETRGYVPMFIAANYVMNYYPQHNISPVLPTKPLVTDTLGISDRVHFNQISGVLAIPVDELRILNPQYRTDLIPGSPERICTLTLPSQQVQAYLMSEKDILAYEAEKYGVRSNVEPGEQPADFLAAVDEESESGADLITPVGADRAATGEVRTITHKVAANQTLADIAAMYNVSPADIRSWNHLRRNAVRPGQTLRIETAAVTPAAAAPAAQSRPAQAPKQTAAPQGKQSAAPAASAPAKSQKKQQSAAAPKKQKTKEAAPKPANHEVKSGETLSSISKKYGVTVDELRKANNLTGDNIRAGATLKVPAKASASKAKTSGSRKSSGKSTGKKRSGKKSGKKSRR